MYSKLNSTLPFQAHHNLCCLHLTVIVQQFLHDLRLKRVRQFLSTTLFNCG